MKIPLRTTMTCLTMSCIGAYEYLTKKASGRDIDVSRLFIYYNARVRESQGGELTDSGCSMTSAVESLEQYGVCLESIWPYNINDMNQCPYDEAYQQADQLRISDALQIDVDLHQMKSCLAQGFPFAFGLNLFTTFDNASKNGIVPMPNSAEQSRQSHGR
jgi:hypothetical protein